MPADPTIFAAMAKTHNQLAIVAQKSWQSLTQNRSMGQLTEERSLKTCRSQVATFGKSTLRKSYACEKQGGSAQSPRRRIETPACECFDE